MNIFNSILCVPSVKSHFTVIVIMKGRDWLTARLIIMRYVHRAPQGPGIKFSSYVAALVKFNTISRTNNTNVGHRLKTMPIALTTIELLHRAHKNK